MALLPPPEAFEPYLRVVINATYHRTAQMMSSPKNVLTLYDAAKYASEHTDLGGHVEWVIPDRMFIWRGVNMLGIDTSHLRFIGLASGKNTLIMRIGWYKLHLFVARVLGFSPKKFPS